MQTRPILRTASAWLGTLCLAALTACGGAEMDDEPMGKTSSEPQVQAAQAAAAVSVPSAKTIVLQQEGARLNTAELEAIAKTGVLPQAFDGPLLSGDESVEAKSVGVQKSAASRVPVYRFFNAGTGAHFFTTSTAERDNIIATLPAFSYEGVAFYTSNAAIPGLSPVHRFFNTNTNVHFYTISESERASVVANLPQFTYEGIAFYASTLPGTGYTPLYRFFFAARGFHFYTNSLTERDNIIAMLPQYTYEGVSYHVLGDDWQTPAVPDTGVSSRQCYQAGSDALVDCGTAGANSLNAQQNGDRAGLNPMSYAQYSQVSGSVRITKPITSCVQDEVTGLLWEGKEATGTRAGFNTYTNYGDGRVGDASTYVNAVNAMQVCGFNDWRLPNVEELQDLVHHGEVIAPKITKPWFPNTQPLQYWTNTSYAAAGADVAWVINFSDVETVPIGRSASRPVRLVRGAAWTGTRYMVSSATYPGDSANNAVIDRKTGLTWRRCEQGRFWSGTACVGTASTFNHEAALSHAQSQTGWRLPHAKELASLQDFSRIAPSLSVNAFPSGTVNAVYWSSSPRLVDSANAVGSFFDQGFQFSLSRTTAFSVRLVLID